MRVFITGMAGTLGTALALEHAARGDTVFGCSRNEERCVGWMKKHHKAATLYCCDCENLINYATDVSRLLPTLDRVYHCAAMKHVDLCEQNPAAAIYQNVAITMHLASVCAEEGVKFVFVSSDKACLPVGVYGASKLMAEKVTLSFDGGAVRLGNLIGSSGSVFRLWNQALVNGDPVKVTDPNMTRYFYPISQAVSFLIHRTLIGSVVVPANMKAVRMGHVADVYRRMGGAVEETGPRPGETPHQYLVAPDSTVLLDGDRIVLGEDKGTLLTAGLSSQWASQWDIDELLAEAGVPGPVR